MEQNVPKQDMFVHMKEAYSKNSLSNLIDTNLVDTLEKDKENINVIELEFVKTKTLKLVIQMYLNALFVKHQNQHVLLTENVKLVLLKLKTNLERKEKEYSKTIDVLQKLHVFMNHARKEKEFVDGLDLLLQNQQKLFVLIKKIKRREEKENTVAKLQLHVTDQNVENLKKFVTPQDLGLAIENILSANTFHIKQ